MAVPYANCNFDNAFEVPELSFRLGRSKTVPTRRPPPTDERVAGNHDVASSSASQWAWTHTAWQHPRCLYPTVEETAEDIAAYQNLPPGSPALMESVPDDLESHLHQSPERPPWFHCNLANPFNVADLSAPLNPTDAGTLSPDELHLKEQLQAADRDASPMLATQRAYIRTTGQPSRNSNPVPAPQRARTHATGQPPKIPPKILNTVPAQFRNSPRPDIGTGPESAHLDRPHQQSGPYQAYSRHGIRPEPGTSSRASPLHNPHHQTGVHHRPRSGRDSVPSVFSMTVADQQASHVEHRYAPARAESVNSIATRRSPPVRLQVVNADEDAPSPSPSPAPFPSPGPSPRPPCHRSQTEPVPRQDYPAASRVIKQSPSTHVKKVVAAACSSASHAFQSPGQEYHQRCREAAWEKSERDKVMILSASQILAALDWTEEQVLTEPMVLEILRRYAASQAHIANIPGPSSSGILRIFREAWNQFAPGTWAETKEAMIAKIWEKHQARLVSKE